jgi:hypothetical protein
MAQHREFIHLHLRLVFTIDALVSDQSSSGDHVRGHPVPYMGELACGSLVRKLCPLPMNKMTFFALFCSERGRTIQFATVLVPL